MISLADRIALSKVTLSTTYKGCHWDKDENWAYDKWVCVLRLNGRRMQVTFRQGTGFNGADPELPDLFHSLLADASGYLNSTSYEDWCADYGFNPSASRFSKIYNAVRSQTERLSRFLDSSLSLWLDETDWQI